ncbi:MAG: ABC transporter permease subunit [Actinomycetes bacterium]
MTSLEHSIPIGVRASSFIKEKISAVTFFWFLIIALLVAPIILFLSVAFSPRMLDQGTAWFTLGSFKPVFKDIFYVSLIHSVVLGVVAAFFASVIALTVAWYVLRTNTPARKIWNGCIFALLLAPSYLIALGWERIFERGGVLNIFGVDLPFVRTLLYGPVGMGMILTFKGIPFAYLVISNAMRGLGEEFEQAVRVHGGSRWDAFKTMSTLLLPAIWSGVAIVFAETISDFGVASQLSSPGRFSVATFTLYRAIESIPVLFPVCAAVSVVLLALVVLALIAQSRALRGRSFRVLSGRTRPVSRQQLSRCSKIISSGGILLLLFVTLGVPVFGAISASMIRGIGSLLSNYSITLDNYIRVLKSPLLRDPLIFSAKCAAITACVAVVLAAISSRMLVSTKNSTSKKLLDFFLLAAVGLPGIVFAAGYIFAYNLPLAQKLGFHLYGTVSLLVLAYIATALPSTTRSLVGNMNQFQESLSEACRVHGSTALRTWISVVLPLIARPILAAWCLTYCGTLLELPVSQLLFPPNHAPLAVGIDRILGNYDFGGGTAIEVLAIISALLVVGIAFGLFEALVPKGWKQLGKAHS